MTGPAPERWTVLSLMEWTTAHLASWGFDEARLNVELMLAHVLGLRRLDLYLQFDRPLSQEDRAAFRVLYERRLHHEPLQYIIGTSEFMGLTLEVNRSVLIPRPETENLVQAAVASARQSAKPPERLLDIGTGSGNIALAMAKYFPSARIRAIDKSSEAIAVASRNAERNHITSVVFDIADIFTEERDRSTYDMILANPPYICAADIATLDADVREFEPMNALTDGGDGLKFYPRIAEIAGTSLREGGEVFVEVGFDQSLHVCEIFREKGLNRVDIIRDSSGIQRIVRGTR